MPRFVDFTGRTFGRLTVVERAPSYKGRTLWTCRCACGTLVTADRNNLVRGATLSCGCWYRETRGQHTRTHGRSKTRLYNTWKNMRRRCLDPTHEPYSDYGGRGITVCERWDSFENFLADMGERPGPEYTLHRIENDGNYEPGNVRWALCEEQVRHKRNNILLTYQGETHILAEWARIVGLDQECLRMRVKAGWDTARALETPVRGKDIKPSLGV